MAGHRVAEFRFALGRSVGMGHLRRSEALAVELAARGWETYGTCHGAGPGEKPLRGISLSEEFPVFEEAAGIHPDLVVVDSYLLTLGDRKAIKDKESRLVCFLDAPAEDPADLVVDVNLGAEAAAYAAAGCRSKVLLAGPDYFCVRPALLHHAALSRKRDRSGPVENILLTFGGSDWHHLAERTLEELSWVSLRLNVRLVVGDLSRQRPALGAALQALPCAEMTATGAEIAEHFTWADMALSAAGLTKYELALCGVPAIIVAIAENQVPSAKEFSRRRLARYLGRADALPKGALARSLEELLAGPGERAAMSAAGKRLVDGRGAARIADEIEKLMEGTA